MPKDELLALKASAGSGKTFALTQRYLTLLFHGAHPAEILTLTFTKKAALEMKGRITKALENLAHTPQESQLEMLEKAGFSREFILQNSAKIYKRFLQADLKIMTIDAFLNAVVKKFCWYAGIPHDFEIKSPDEEAILERFLDSLNAKEREELFNLSLEEGKNLESIGYLLRDLWQKESELGKGYAPKKIEGREEEILALARVIQGAVLLSKEASDRAKNAVKFESVEELLKRGGTWLCKDSLSEYQYFKKLKLEAQEGAFWRLKALLPDYFNAKESRLLARLLRLLGRFRQSVEAWQKQERALGFDDVARGAYRLLREEIDREFLYFRLDSQITHILIDEFQDTSLLQYRILEPLIEEIKAGISRQLYRTFFYVGDVKQSIYRFRGSYAPLFEWVAQGMEVKELPNNYRSQAEVVEFVNATFAPHFEGYAPQNPMKSGGYVEVKSADEPLESLLEVIEGLLAHGVSPDEVAILVFNNGDVLKVAEALWGRFEGLGVVTETSAKLLEQPEVRALHRALFYVQAGKEVDGVSFLAMRGEPPELERLGFLQELRDSQSAEIILKLMERFHLFSASARRFLEIAIAFPRLEEFLRHCESLEEPLSAEELHGVRILTIHKSKGLEFPHVIVLDRLSGSSNRRDSLLYDYEGVNLGAIRYRLSGRENFDQGYAKSLEQEERAEHQDLLNLLYVALTRAEESLHIVQKSQKSALEILALTPQTRGIAPLKQGERPRSAPLQESRLYEAEEWGRQRDFLQKEGDSKVYAPRAVHYGEAFHLALEHALKYHASLETLSALVENRYGHLLQEEAQEIAPKALALVKNSFLASILREGRLECEVPFLDNGKVRRIDLLIEREAEAIVIDYKSTSMPQEGYYKQVEAYKRFVKKALGKPTRGFLLLYGDEPRLLEV